MLDIFRLKQLAAITIDMKTGFIPLRQPERLFYPPPITGNIANWSPWTGIWSRVQWRELIMVTPTSSGSIPWR